MKETQWQLALSRRSLKKQAKLRALGRQLQPAPQEKCLEVGCDTGVISHFLRSQGGDWTSIDLEEVKVKQAKGLVGGKFAVCEESELPFLSGSFRLVAVIDFLEHLDDDERLLGEAKRLLARGGTLYVSVPRCEWFLFLNYLRRLLGIRPEHHGHKRPGYSRRDLKEKVQGAGFEVKRTGSYSRLFTELVELGVNAVYLFFRRKGRAGKGRKGAISPSSREEFEKERRGFFVYRVLYPFLWFLGQVDRLLFFLPGYVLFLRAELPESDGG